MKNLIYLIGLISTLTIIFGCIIHFFGNQYGDIVIVIGAAVTTLSMFIIDKLSHSKG